MPAGKDKRSQRHAKMRTVVVPTSSLPPAAYSGLGGPVYAGCRLFYLRFDCNSTHFFQTQLLPVNEAVLAYHCKFY
jgi:hypothetical protein